MSKYDDYKIITMVNPSISEKNIDLALLVQKAILTGKCNECKYLKECESNRDFKFPSDVRCIINEI